MNNALNQHQVFLKIEKKSKSVAKASEELLLTQWAVFAQPKTVQGKFEKVSIKVIGRKIYATDFGCEMDNG